MVTIADIKANKPLILIGGPCAIESEQQIEAAAQAVAAAGAQCLRGGAFKPRTSHKSFQGLGIPGLEMMAKAAKAHGLRVISEVMKIEDIEQMIDFVDVFQVGSRNMYNYSLLNALSEVKKPTLLKRAFSATYEEFIAASEYLRQHGNDEIMLCERGIRTFEPSTRNTLDLTAVPILKRKTGLTVIVDPSHGTGERDLIEPMSMAAVACGADGLMIETHPNPDQSISDAKQAICFDTFQRIANKASTLAKSI